jgi:HEAT repeat protein
MTAAELRAKLNLIEPNESMYQGIGPADIPALEELIRDPEEWLTGRVVFALSRVGGSAAVSAMARAAADPRPPVRVAIAAAASQRAMVLPDTALVPLLRDQDAGVRKFATLAVRRENGSDAQTLLNHLASEDAVPAVRANAAEALGKLR